MAWALGQSLTFGPRQVQSTALEAEVRSDSADNLAWLSALVLSEGLTAE